MKGERLPPVGTIAAERIGGTLHIGTRSGVKTNRLPRYSGEDAQSLCKACPGLGKNRGKLGWVPIYRKLDNARLQFVRHSDLGLQAVRTTFNLRMIQDVIMRVMRQHEAGATIIWRTATCRPLSHTGSQGDPSFAELLRETRSGTTERSKPLRV